MEDYSEYFSANRELWNKRTMLHRDSSFYDLAGFKAGKNVLNDIELNALGDVHGKSLLHLQCHFGMDSLNWSRLGAQVTGIDLSDEAIREARRLNEELKLDARFVCCNIYELGPGKNKAGRPDPLGAAAHASFDIVFTSYGVVGWLPELDRWAEIIAYYLKPGGIFFLAEFHPVLWMFDDGFKEIKYHYDNKELIVSENLPDYADPLQVVEGKEFSWNHSLAEVINALIGVGLKVERFDELMYSPYACFSNMVATSGGNWHIKGMEGKLPMVYTIKAVKQ